MQQPAPQPAAGPRTCLLVDDSRMIRKVARRIVEGVGYAVIEAENGEEGLARCRAAMPDLVMLDVCMPEFSGLGVLSLMRRFKRPPPTFVVTGFAHSSIDLIANRRGAVTVFHKPIDLDELVAAIEDAIPPR